MSTTPTRAIVTNKPLARRRFLREEKAEFLNRPGQRGRAVRESLTGYGFLVPWLIGFFGLTLVPMVYSLYLSFTDYSLIGEANWIGRPPRMPSGSRQIHAQEELGVRLELLHPAREKLHRLDGIHIVEDPSQDPDPTEFLGVHQEWLGFVDSGYLEDYKVEDREQLPDGCFARVPLAEAAAPLVELMRSFRLDCSDGYSPRVRTVQLPRKLELVQSSQRPDVTTALDALSLKPMPDRSPVEPRKVTWAPPNRACS